MITVLGASGFIGSHLVSYLNERSIPCYAPERNADLMDRDLGQVIYCIGLTADFRSRPLDTVEAHVCKLVDVLRNCRFDSLVYVSSTRVYGSLRGNRAAENESPCVDTLDPSQLYNLSKLMGESVGLHAAQNVRVVRVSNVYGDDWASDNFLPSIIRSAVDLRYVRLQTSLDSAKDYLSLANAVEGLYLIASQGKRQLYNLAAGFNISNRDLMERISDFTDCEWEIVGDAPTIVFPRISIQQLQRDIDFQPTNLLDEIGDLIRSYTEYGAKRA